MKTRIQFFRFAIIASILFIGIGSYSQILQPKSVNYFKWKCKTNAPVYATALVHNSIAYIGSLDSCFYAIDTKLGEIQWKLKCTEDIRSTAVLADETILFESGNILYAVSIEGTIIWKSELAKPSENNQLDPWDFFHSSPVIYDNVVYIGTTQGLVKGFAIDSGKEVFSYQTESKDMIRTTPLIKDNSLFFGDWEGVFYSYDMKKEKLNWKYDTKTDTVYSWKNSIHHQPVIFENSILFAGRSSRIYSLNIDSGKKNWMYVSPTNEWLIGGMCVDSGLLYIGSSDQHLVHAVDCKTGKLGWEANVDCRTWGRPYVNKKNLYIGSNAFHVINKISGKLETIIPFEAVHKDEKFGDYVNRTANFHSSPVLSNDALIIGSDDGYVYAIDSKKL